MRIFVIMVGFGPKRQIWQSLLRFVANRNESKPENHRYVFVNGHFPLNYQENQAGLREMVEGLGFEFLDPGKDLGSAQSQEWALKQVGADPGDFFINLDPDSACDNPSWLEAVISTIKACPDVAILSLNTFWHWERIYRLGALPVETRFVGPYRVLLPLAPDLFNLSIWRCEALSRLGGILQGTPYWGNVESMMRTGLERLGYRTAIIYDFMEATDLKLLQPFEFIDWKYRHGILRNYPGSFTQYCEEMGKK